MECCHWQWAPLLLPLLLLLLLLFQAVQKAAVSDVLLLSTGTCWLPGQLETSTLRHWLHC